MLDQIHRLATDVVASLRSARVTTEPIRLKYVNLGDFGGTDPVVDSWVLEVAGSYDAMQPLIPVLKKFKFRYDSRGKSWRLDATKYAYSNRKRDNFWNAARRNQQAAYPIIKKLVDQHNAAAASANSGSGQTTVKDLVKNLKSKDRLKQRLEGLGLRVEYEWPDKYSVDEATAWVFGNTFAVKDVMKKYGFRWGSGRKGKGWWIPTIEYPAIVDKWAADVIRALPAQSTPVAGATPFSDMSRSELMAFIKKHDLVTQDMELNEWYDGEVSGQQVARSLMTNMPKWTPATQQEVFDSGRLE